MATPDAAWQRLGIEAERLDAARAHVVDEHVRAGNQCDQRIARDGVLEVEGKASLVAVVVQEHRGHAGVAARAEATHRVARGRLDLDDVRAHVAEDLGAERSEKDRRQVDHPDPG
jgi:hypothetical protein